MTEILSGIIAEMRHVRIAMGCGNPWQVRKFLNRNGLDAREFFKHGLPVEALEATGDAMAIDVARAARGRIE